MFWDLLRSPDVVVLARLTLCGANLDVSDGYASHVAPGEGALRLTRAAGFAVSAVGLAGAAHLADGDEVPLSAALLAVPLVMLVVHLLAGRRAGPLGLFLGMGLTQVALHLGFMAASITPTCVPA